MSHPLIYIPKTLELGVDLPSVRLEGWYTVELIDAKTGFVKRKLSFRNLITNAGLDRVGTVTGRIVNNIQYAEMGTGSTAPADTDVNLVAAVTPRTNANGSISDVTGYVAGPPDYNYVRMTRLFTEAQANGNLTEIGMWSALTGGTMTSRQLLKDGAGTPTTIVKTASDQLRITYEIRSYPPLGDTVLPTIVLDGVTYTPTTRVQGANIGSRWGLISFAALTTTTNHMAAVESDVLVARTSVISGSTQLSSCTVAAYVTGNYYRDRTGIWEPSVANYATGIGLVGAYAIQDNNSLEHLFQVKFTPKIAKTNTKRLTLTFRESWGRYP